MRICYTPAGFHGSAAGFYRCHFPFYELKEQGHSICSPKHRRVKVDGEKIKEVTIFDLRTMPDADVYVFQMYARRGVVDLVRDLKKLGKVCVGEADDNTLNLPKGHPAYEQLNPANDSENNWDHLRSTFQACDGLTVSTEALKQSYAKVNPTIEVIPNYLAWAMWEDVTPQYEVERDRVRIGWMGNSEIRLFDLEILKPVIRPFLEAHPEVDFVAAADERVHEILDVPEAQRVSYPGVSFPAGLPRLTATMDVGLVPLEINEFNQSKSALKGMEYAACGIPCIASPTEEYKRWVRPWHNGFLASDTSQWRRWLDYLVTDSAARQGMGRAAREKVQSHLISEHAYKWADLYEGLLEKKERTLHPKMAFPRSRPSSGVISKQRSTA